MAQQAQTVIRKSLAEDVTHQPVAGGKSKVRVDKEKHVLYDVKIAGFISKNRRRYVKEGMSLAMYDDKPVNVNHTEDGSAAKVHDMMGWVQGPYFEEDGIYAKEFHYDPFHPLRESLEWWAENRPDKMGFSQNAVGNVLETVEGEVVQEVTEVISIDLVTRPATVKGLYEGVVDVPNKEDRELVEKAKKIIEEWEKIPKDKLPPATPSLVEKEVKESEVVQDIRKLLEGYGYHIGDDDVAENLACTAQKIFLHKDMPPKEKMSKIKSLLKIHHGESSEESKKMEESLKGLQIKPENLEGAKKLLLEAKLPAAEMIVGKLDEYEIKERMAVKEAKARQMCESAKLNPDLVTEFFVKSLMKCSDEKEMQEAIDDRRKVFGAAGTVTGTKPRSAAGDYALSGAPPPAGDAGATKTLTEEEKKKKEDDAFLAFEAQALSIS